MQAETHAKQFRGLLDELDRVHMRKIAEYGLARYKGDLDFNLHAAFFDIDRKYIRLRHQINQWFSSAMDRNETVHIGDLRETFMDLASYAIMGMQILDLMQDETLTEVARDLR